jgi:hypothetical protein
MKKTFLAALFLALASLAARAGSLPPVLKMQGSPDRAITPESLLGDSRRDVRLEDTGGDVAVYHGMALLDVLEKNGLDTKTMGSQRRLASTCLVATSRDGYTVVFSLGELLMHRSDPRVFLVAETAAGPLEENQGPVRLIVYGDRPRSAYALSSFELKQLAENARKP